MKLFFVVLYLILMSHFAMIEQRAPRARFSRYHFSFLKKRLILKQKQPSSCCDVFMFKYGLLVKLCVACLDKISCRLLLIKLFCIF